MGSRTVNKDKINIKWGSNSVSATTPRFTYSTMGQNTVLVPSFDPAGSQTIFRKSCEDFSCGTFGSHGPVMEVKVCQDLLFMIPTDETLGANSGE